MIDFAKTVPVTIAISFLALLAYMFPAYCELFEYYTKTMPLDQPLQLIGCHLLHWSADHLFWDLGMFVVLGAICERISRQALLGLLLISALVIPPVVGICYPEIETYRGLSGLDTALFGLATFALGLRRLKDGDREGFYIYLGLVVGMFCKIGHELVVGNTIFVQSSNFAPVPIAHVAGAFTGILAGIHVTRNNHDRVMKVNTSPK